MPSIEVLSVYTVDAAHNSGEVGFRGLDLAENVMTTETTIHDVVLGAWEQDSQGS